MTEANIADTKPAVLELEAGDYFWCSCGNSKNQPYCDGAHTVTDFVPKKFTLEEKQKVALCLCKQTNNPPYCDGNHSKIKA